MIDRYAAVVLAMDDVVEEEVLLLVNGIKVKCFASYCPEKVEVGESYDVEFEVVLSDAGIIVTAEKSVGTLVEMINDGFACVLYGYLDGSTFRSFIDFTDQEIHYDYPELNGQFVKVKVDRIDVAF